MYGVFLVDFQTDQSIKLNITNPYVNMKPEQNLDQHLFSEEEGNHFSPKCFMTKDRKLGIDVGGHVSVRSLSEWMEALQLKEMKKFEDNLADKGYLYQCGTDHPVSGIKTKDYCDQCGNTGFSLFDGKRCVHKDKIRWKCVAHEFPNPEPNVHINKGLDVNIQDQPILKQIEHYQRLIQDSWHKINKLIRESEEK